jgi:hypothetical protein
MSILNIDIDCLKTILSYSGIYGINVCSSWNDIIKKNLFVCSKCKKIVKIYDVVLWKSTIKNYMCHNELVKSKIVDVQLNCKGKRLFTIMEQFQDPEIRITFVNETDNNSVKLGITGHCYKVDIGLDRYAIDSFTSTIDNVNFLINTRELNKFILSTNKMKCPLKLSVKKGYGLSLNTKNRYLILESDACFEMKCDEWNCAKKQIMPIYFY